MDSVATSPSRDNPPHSGSECPTRDRRLVGRSTRGLIPSTRGNRSGSSLLGIKPLHWHGPYVPVGHLTLAPILDLPGPCSPEDPNKLLAPSSDSRRHPHTTRPLFLARPDPAFLTTGHRTPGGRRRMVVARGPPNSLRQSAPDSRWRLPGNRGVPMYPYLPTHAHRGQAPKPPGNRSLGHRQPRRPIGTPPGVRTLGQLAPKPKSPGGPKTLTQPLSSSLARTV